MLSFQIKNQNIRLISKTSRDLIDNQINFVECQFEFSDDWKDLQKIIQFKQEDQIFNIYGGTDNSIVLNIPAKVHEGDLFVAVQGYVQTVKEEIENPQTGEKVPVYDIAKKAETNTYYTIVTHSGFQSTDDDIEGDPDTSESNIGDKSYIHVQRTADKYWGIKHNMNKFPSVTVQDSAGTNVTGEIQYVDVNSLILIFTHEMSGRAFLN